MKNIKKLVLFVSILCSSYVQIRPSLHSHASFSDNYKTTLGIPDTSYLKTCWHNHKLLNEKAIRTLSKEKVTEIAKEKLDYVIKDFYDKNKKLLFNDKTVRDLEDDMRWRLFRTYAGKEGLKISQKMCVHNETYRNIINKNNYFENNPYKLLVEINFLNDIFAADLKIDGKNINEYLYDSLEKAIEKEQAYIKDPVEYQKMLKLTLAEARYLGKEVHSCIDAEKKAPDRFRLIKTLYTSNERKHRFNTTNYGFYEINEHTGEERNRMEYDLPTIMEAYEKNVTAKQGQDIKEEIIDNHKISTISDTNHGSGEQSKNESTEFKVSDENTNETLNESENKTEPTSDKQELLNDILSPDPRKNELDPGQAGEVLKSAPEKVSLLESISRSVLGSRANQTVFGLLTYSHVFKGTLISGVAGTVCLAVYKIHSLMTRNKKNQSKIKTAETKKVAYFEKNNHEK
ncbi:hypothetical protein IPH25_02535 [bacterium]|nr:MAG: hypothetical protein IPG37_04675 [bacterium]QQR62297.1 MAG: hypothetical protein IPH25_02535 [bacterium]QQR63135.1 MAG: hypothetical protein IPH67_01515 [bacterium]